MLVLRSGRLRSSFTTLPDRSTQPCGRRRYTSSSKVDCTNPCSASKWYRSSPSSHAMAVNKRTLGKHGRGEKISRTSIPSLCENPLATNLALARTTLPNSFVFQAYIDLDGMTLVPRCYVLPAGTEVPTAASLTNSLSSAAFQIAPCDPECACAYVRGVSRELESIGSFLS